MKESTEVRITQKVGKERGNSYRKNEEISGWKARTHARTHTHTQKRKLDWNVSMITDVFLNQKRVNVCEYTIFTMCLHTFTLFWSRKLSVIIKMFQLSFCVVAPFVRKSLLFFSKRFVFFFLFFNFLVGYRSKAWLKLAKIDKALSLVAGALYGTYLG